MSPVTRALYLKEWIKLRKGLAIPALLLAAACIDTFLVLRGIESRHGALGLWLTLMEKEPPFYRTHLSLALSGLIIGFLQAWPECQGRRLRLLFHLPTQAPHSVAVLTLTGQALTAALGLLSLGATAATMAAFGLPGELLRPVLLSLIPWLLLAQGLHLAMVSVLAARGWSLRLGILAAAYAAWGLMGGTPGYGLLAPGLPGLLLLTLLFVPLAFHAFLSAMGERNTRGAAPLRLGASLLVGLALITLLPAFGRRLLPAPASQGRIHYSPVRGQFTRTVPQAPKGPGPLGQEGVRYRLEDGQELTRLQYAEALPVLYLEDLLKWRRFPDTIAGQPADPLRLKQAWMYRQDAPSDWNGPEHRLHLMLESSPRGARLELPSDIFRLSSDRCRLEFLRPGSAGADLAKGERFTRALAEKGFAFPVAAIGGNPDVRKEYDLGHLLVDARGGLFRLAMVQGEPRCWKGPQAVEGRVRAVLVQEHRSRRWMGSLVTDRGYFLVDQTSLALRPLPLEGFDAGASRVSLWSDPFGISAVHQHLGSLQVQAVALDPGLGLLRTWSPAPDRGEVLRRRRLDLAWSLLFPLSLEQGGSDRQWEDLRITLAPRPAPAFLASGLLAAGLLALQARKGRIRPLDALLTALLGACGLLALLLVSAWKPWGPRCAR